MVSTDIVLVVGPKDERLRPGIRKTGKTGKIVQQTRQVRFASI